MNRPAGPRRLSKRTRRRLGRATSRWFRARHEVLWLFLVALAVRVAAALASPAILRDSAELVGAAERVRDSGAGAAIAGPDHPLMPWLVAALTRWFDAEHAATGLSVLAGAFAVWPLHVLARRACGRHAATGACIVYAALPKAVAVASVPLTSALLLPLLLSALSLVVAAGSPCSERRRIVRLLSAGVLAGLAYLCRPEGLVAAGAAVVGALALLPRGKRFASAALVASAFVVVAAPYVVMLSTELGKFELTPKKDLARFAGLAPTPNASADAPPSDAASAIHDAAGAVEGALTVPVFLLILVGAFSTTRWHHRRSIVPRTWLIGLAAVFLALVVRLNVGWDYGGARHVLPGGLLLLPFAGEGLVLLGGFISRVVARRRLVVVVASFLAIPLAVKAMLRPEGEDQAGARRLGEAIAERVRATPGEDTVVASFGQPLVAYYARRRLADVGGTARDVPLWRDHRALILVRSDLAGQRAALADRLHHEGARWIVLDLFRTTTRATGETVFPQRELAERLRDDGVLGAPVVAPGGELAAFPVR